MIEKGRKYSIIYILQRVIPFLMKYTACHSMKSCLYFCGFRLVIVPPAVLVIDENQSDVPLALDVVLSGSEHL